MASPGSTPPVTAIPATMGWLREGMNGLVVLASGILTFGAGLYKDFALDTFVQRILFACSASALLLTILCGVFCAFWLNRYVNLRENEGAQQQLPADDSLTGQHLDTGVMPAGMRSARARYYFFYYSTLVAFCASMIFVTILLLAGVFSTNSASKVKKDCQPCSLAVQPTPGPLGYSISISAPHIGAHGTRVQHTFLLDQSTGRVWQMFCREGRKEVEFRKIEVEGVQDSRDASVRH